MLQKNFLLVALLSIIAGSQVSAQNPKREFRGAWLHTVGQDHFTQRTTEENKKYLVDQLDKMQEAGVNAVIFQVRPVADAFYVSDIEPWSRYLTGEIGKAPDEIWDPLQFMIEESHSRGMELHAWLNPYRSVMLNETTPEDHITKTEPERFIVFTKRYFFDPGLPENREYIADVVGDIVSRYDIDAIHMDDYFYPYPVKGEKFGDDKSYEKYGNGMSREDWRRDNVNKLIEDLSATIHSIKPWVRFGISPFGIWRNESSDPRGSKTNGLQNYDDLYADVTLWAKEGWIDYQVPQLYWELDHKRASSRILADWWNENAFDRHMYFGQNVVKSMDLDELGTKIDISRRLPNVQGNVWWPSVQVTKNYKNVLDSLASGPQSTIALTPVYPWLADETKISVAVPTNLEITDGVLSWEYYQPDEEPSINDVNGIVIYRLPSKNTVEELGNPSNIIAVIRGEDCSWDISDKVRYGDWICVTSLDRINRESAPSKPIRYNPE